MILRIKCDDYRIKSVDKKLLFRPSKISLNKFLLTSLSLPATMVLMLKTRRASTTLNVPSAESFLPLKGYTSGLRWH